MGDKTPGQDDVPLYGPETDEEPANLVPSGLAQGRDSVPSPASTAGYRGLLTGHEADQWPGAEVWSMKLVYELETGWFGSTGYLTVREVLPVISYKVSNWEEYAVLRRSMEIYGQKVPIRIFHKLGNIPPRLRDGINRIAIADIMGWDSMIVSAGIMEKSMWQEWDESEEGKNFHSLKGRRLGLRDV